MTRTRPTLAPPVYLSLWAHKSAPARVELVYRSTSQRLIRTALALIVCWGAVPILLWFPPHYPWVTIAILAGAYLAHRNWTGRYAVQSFAGICPRCGAPLSIGIDRVIDLPHTLTCFNCHFEPKLEVRLAPPEHIEGVTVLEHQRDDCVGEWEKRWLADAPFIYCEDCHAGAALTPEVARLAEEENERGEILRRLGNEGWPLI